MAKRLPLLAGLGALLLAASAYRWWFPAYDDAFITLTSAQALWTGRIPNLPEATPLYGVTSPVHCGLVALLLPLAPTPLAALYWSLLLGAAVYVTGLWRLTAPLEGWHRWAVLATGLLAGTVWNQLSNGLETGLAMGVAAWILVGVREDARWLPALLGAAPWVRPEFAAVSAALALRYIALLRFRAWRPLGEMIVAAVPLALWLYADVGSIAPTSLSAKMWMHTPQTPFERGICLYLAGRIWLLACGPLIFGMFGLRHHRGGLAILLSLFVILIGYTVSQPALLVLYQAQRYVYPLIPFCLAGLVAVLPRLTAPHRQIAVLASVAYAAALFPHNAAGPLAWRANFLKEYQIEEQLLGTLPRGTVVAVSDVGIPAYISHLPLVDIVGLKTPSAAAVHREITAPSRGRDVGRALDIILRSHHARAFVVGYGWDAIAGFTDKLVALGWTAKDFRPRPPGPVGGYRYELLTPPAQVQ